MSLADRFKTGRPSRAWLAPVLVFVAALITHAGNLANGFTNWDDPAYILNNPLIREFGVGPAAHLFNRFYNNDYYPLNQLSYMVDHAIWGLNPRGYHLTNMLLHAMSAGLAVVVARRLLGSEMLAVLAALAFALHPVNVESVAWLSERKNVLSMAFFLLSFLLYLERDRRPERARLWMAGAFVTFVAATLSKTVVTPYPVLLVVYDWLFMSDCWRRRLREKIPFLLVSAAAAVLTVMSQGEAGAIPPFIGNRFLNNVWTMMGVYLTYLRMLVWPTGLNARYASTFLMTPFDLRVVAGLLAVLVLLAMVWRLRTRAPLLSFSIAWFFITLLPVSHIVPTSVLYADRYLYFPSLAFGWCFAATAGWFAIRWRQSTIIVALLIVGLWIAATVHRTADWRDAVTLWEASVRTDPNNFFAHAILGDAYVAVDQLDKAIEHKERGIALRPNWRHGQIELTNTGLLYYAKGNSERAEELFNQAREAAPYYGPAYKGLGMVARQRGRLVSATYYFLAAVANGVDDVRTRDGLRDCMMKQGHEERWRRFASDPKSVVMEEADRHRAAAAAAAATGDRRTARARLVMASRLLPNDPAIAREIAALSAR